MLDKIKGKINSMFKKKDSPKSKGKKLSPNEQATKDGMPYVNITSMDVNPADISEGAFELDWNDIFLARLIKAGYQGKTDQDIVDNWFQTVCRNVANEVYEQSQADPDNRRDIGGGFSEFR